MKASQILGIILLLIPVAIVVIGCIIEPAFIFIIAYMAISMMIPVSMIAGCWLMGWDV